MPTVAEVLRQSGFTDDQIKAIDQKAIAAFDGLMTDAEKQRGDAETARKEAQQAREAAELAQRSNVDFYENKIAPSLTQWEEDKQKIENEKARHAAEAAFYKTQAEEAKKSGFIPTDAPGFDPAKFTPAPVTPSRDSQGRYVTGAPGSTPGSPTFDVNQIYQRAGDAVGILADIQWEHQRLFGQPMPLSPTELVRQADSVKLDPKTFAARTFSWDVRRQQLRDEETRKHDDEVAAKAVAPLQQQLKDADEQRKKELTDLDRKWSERVGSNPDIRIPRTSEYANHQRAIKANELPDPLDLTIQQRRQLTATMIRKDIDASQV